MPADLKGQFEGRIPFAFIEVMGRTIKVLVDTGFDGFLMLPQTLIESLKLTYLADTKYQTADGKIAYGSTYMVELEWFGKKEQIEVDSTEGNFALLGMGLIYDCRLEIAGAKNSITISKD